MPGMFGQIGVLVQRLRDLSELVITAAWAGAMGFGVAALVAALVIGLDAPLGFGWRFFGWWVLALILFVPAVIVWWFARNVRLLRDTAAELPERFAGLADDAVTELVAVASSARDTVANRRGLLQLVSGALQLRRLAGTFADIAGAAAPVTAALAPTSLLLTAAAAVAGIGVLGLAFVLVAARVLV